MTKANPFTDVTLLLTRLLVAAIFLWHGLPKAIDPAMAAAKFVDFGLPGPLGPVIGILEVAAALLLLAGLLEFWSAAVLGIIIVGALVTVQIPGGVTAGLERDLLILVGILVLMTHEPSRPRLAGLAKSRARRPRRAPSVALDGAVRDRGRP